MCVCFCRTKLYQKNGDVQLLCKAYNGRVVMQWLAETVAGVAQQDLTDAGDDRIRPVALCMFLVLMLDFCACTLQYMVNLQ